MPVIIPVASGKGGVGKTLICANLGIALGNNGKKVILVDLDLGASNLHTFLGVMNNDSGIGSFIQKRIDVFDDLVCETPYRGLYLIHGDNLYPGTANLPYFIKKKIIDGISDLDADFVLLDLGAGSAYNTVDFFLTSRHGMIITTPEITSVLNAYSFIKTCVFRLFYRSFPPKSQERKTVTRFIAQKLEGADVSFKSLLEELSRINPESRETLVSRLSRLHPHIVMNMCRSAQEAARGVNLRRITRKNLNIELEFISIFRNDPSIRDSAYKRRPACILSPDGPFAAEMDKLAGRVSRFGDSEDIALYEEDEDLVRLLAARSSI